jgi:hypothetical protein
MLIMRNIKTLATLFIFFLPAHAAMAQVNFVAGSLIQLNGDTLNGEIDYQEWIYNPKFIRFRKNAAQTAKAFAPKDVKGFMIAGRNEKYQAAIVKVNNETMDAASRNMTVYESVDDINNSSIVWTQDTVFLSVIAQGRLNLYELSYYVDSKTHFFIQQNKGAIDELIYRRVKLQNHDTLAVSTLYTYRTQLRNLTQDCTPNPITNLLPYTRQRMLKLINEYNNCMGQSSYNIKERKGQIYLVPMAGVVRPRIYVSDYFNYNGNAYNGQIVPSYGVALELGYNRVINKLAFGIEFNSAAFQAKFSLMDPSYSKTITINYKINTTSKTFSSYVLYHFKSGQLQPYIKAGVSINYLNSIYLERFHTEPAYPKPYVVPALEFSTRQFQYLAALGLKYNHFFIESRFNGALDAFTFGNEDRAISSRLSLLGGYTFSLIKNKR